MKRYDESAVAAITWIGAGFFISPTRTTQTGGGKPSLYFFSVFPPGHFEGDFRGGDSRPATAFIAKQDSSPLGESVAPPQVQRTLLRRLVSF